MELVRKINDELAIAEAVTLEQWQQIVEAGFQSVLNLRSQQMPLSSAEQEHVEELGLSYFNLPTDINIDAISVEIALRLLQQIDELPKPTLVCNNATLAAAIVLMHIAMRQGETLHEAFQRAEKFGLFGRSVQSLASTSIT